jgi:signal transduction histidine kinase
MKTLWHRISFKFQLIGAFSLITLLALGAVYTFAYWDVQRRFERFATVVADQRAQEIRNILAVYYHHNGSWEGIEQLAMSRLEGRDRNAPPLGGLSRRPPRPEEADRRFAEPFILADHVGKILISDDLSLVGKQIADADLERGLAIFVGAERVGTLLRGVFKPRFSPLEKQFLDSVQLSTLLAGSLALVFSVGLGFLLVRRMARPLSELEVAAGQIAQGRLESRVSVTSDDELGKLGQSFNQMADSLERSEALRRQMVMDVAHELRTPLMVQQSHLELLLDKVAETTPEQLQIIYEQNLLLGRLVKDLQVLAVAEAGELRIERTPVSVAALLNGIAEHVRPAMSEKKISLQIEAPENLPTLCIDRQRIEQILLNLLDNALRHAPSESKIQLCAELKEKEIQISVIDQGPGISADDLPYVFERFYRADKSRSRQSGGFGLGLAIAKHLVEAHGGKIWAENQASEQGAVFKLTLPV